MTTPSLPQAAQPLFRLGRLRITLGALAALEHAAVSPADLLIRHQTGDFGGLDADDLAANQAALLHGDRLLSAYTVGDARLWIITEADRSATTLLLPEEY